MISTNLSAIARKLEGYSTKLFKDVGDSVAKGMHEEFETLVYETPQFTGTTAASWTLSFGSKAGGALASQEGSSITPLKDSGTKATGALAPVTIPLEKGNPLQRGHQNAVRIALERNAGAFNELPTAYRTSSMMIKNAAPGALRAEEGPVRPVNAPEGALERFKERLASKVFKVNLTKVK